MSGTRLGILTDLRRFWISFASAFSSFSSISPPAFLPVFFRFRTWLLSLCLAICAPALAAEYHGQVMFGGLPVPGATVTATQDGRKFVSVTDRQGLFSFSELRDGTWTVVVEMQCFSTIRQEIVVGKNAQAPTWELKLLPLDQIQGQTIHVVAAPTPLSAAAIATAKPESKAPASSPRQKENEDALSQQTSDGFLINGSANN